jgi:hypothetical protein
VARVPKAQMTRTMFFFIDLLLVVEAWVMDDIRKTYG